MFFFYITNTTDFSLGGPDSRLIRTASLPHTVRKTKGLLHCSYIDLLKCAFMSWYTTKRGQLYNLTF